MEGYGYAFSAWWLAHGTPPPSEAALDPRWLFLASLFGLCGWAVYTDMTRGVVSNRNILALLGLGVVVQGYAINRGTQTWLGLLALALVALGVGLGLFLMQFWAAGDGKLFLALCLAMPLPGGVGGFLSVPSRLLLWSVTLGSLVMLALRARPIIREVRWTLMGLGARWRNDRGATARSMAGALAHLVLYTLAFMGLFRMVGKVSLYMQGPMQGLLLAWLLRWYLDKLPGRWRYLILVLLLGAAVYYSMGMRPLELFQLALIYSLSRLGQIVIQLSTRALSQRVSLQDLKPGHFLVERLARQEDGRVRVFTPSDWAAVVRRGEALEVVLGPEHGALGPADVDTVRSLAGEGRIPAGQTIAVAWNLPFSPFIAAGLLITVGTWLWPTLFTL